MNEMLPYEMRALAHKHRIFTESIQPIIRLKARVYGYKVPRFIIKSDSIMTMAPFELTPDEAEYLRLLDEQIDAIGRSVYGPEWSLHAARGK